MGKVLIKCIQTPMQKYFYDRSLDSVVMVNDEEYQILKTVEKTKLVPDGVLRRFVKSGLLRETAIEEIEHPETENLHLLAEHYMGNLILQVTQQCNLRCKYCAYSGNYYNRSHTSNRMDFETAKKAIDFYLKRSEKADQLALSFYGGEPLLEFELIKKCVSYILQRKGDKKILFTMTTNGTLMTEDVIEFLVKYEFNLMISLDGDKKSHDINRRFKTGKGSFDIILENLSRLKAYNEEYYSKVLFNCVISSSSDLENIYRFYSEEELFEAGTVNFNYVNPVGLKDETLSRITQKNFRVHRLAYIKVILSVLEKRKWDAQSRLLRRELQDIELLYEQLHSHVAEGKKTHHGGPCIPAVRRLFVDTKGEFFPCERVSEEDSEMCIGSLDSGFDFDKMSFLLNHGKMIKEKCLGCWNLRMCAYCLAQIPKDNQILTENMLLQQCENSKESTLLLLYKLCILVEFGYKGNENLQVLK